MRILSGSCMLHIHFRFRTQVNGIIRTKDNEYALPDSRFPDGVDQLLPMPWNGPQIHNPFTVKADSVPLLYFLPLCFGAEGVWICFPVSDFLASILTVIMLIGLFRKLSKLNDGDDPSILGSKL